MSFYINDIFYTFMFYFKSDLSYFWLTDWFDWLTCESYQLVDYKINVGIYIKFVNFIGLKKKIPFYNPFQLFLNDKKHIKSVIRYFVANWLMSDVNDLLRYNLHKLNMTKFSKNKHFLV